MKKIISIFQYTTITIGIIVIIMFLVPRFFGIKPYIVLSGSMEPKIRTGSVAYINSNVKAEEIKVGDVIAFNTGTKQITHRVISINDDKSFKTKGDANSVADKNKVNFSNYFGKTIFSLPYLGFLLGAFQTKFGYIVLIAIVGINIITLLFYNSAKKADKKRKIIKQKHTINDKKLIYIKYKK